MNGREVREEFGGGTPDPADDSSLSDLSSPRDLPDDFLSGPVEELPASPSPPMHITSLPSSQEELPHGVEASIEVYTEALPVVEPEPEEPEPEEPEPEEPKEPEESSEPEESPEQPHESQTIPEPIQTRLPDACRQTPMPLRLPPLRDGVHRSLASSLSVLTDHSEVSSAPSLVSSSSKATTPVDTDVSLDATRLPSAVSAAATDTTPTIKETVEAPVEEPVEAQIEEPVEPQAVEAPVEDLVEEPVEAPVEEPVEAPVEEPVEAPVEELVEAPPVVEPPTSMIIDTEAPVNTVPVNTANTVPTSFLPPPSLPGPSKPFRSIRIIHKVRPKSSIPADLSAREYARQCVAAAESSRLNPYALSEEERVMLRQHISFAQVTTYLNIRNGILRLWVRRPQVVVTRQEAMGCAKDSRWFDTAGVCFHWLLLRGYINYGCVQMRGLPSRTSHAGQSAHRTRTRIVVIGAGFAGLGCARQLDSLFKQYAVRLAELGHGELPEVIVLEGRNRIGGRVYSKAFQQQKPTQPFRSTAEMGGMIITGFDRGNPLNILLRGQLGIPYHALWSEMMLYDTDGRPVDSRRDTMVEDLFNECLDRVSQYKFKLPVPTLVEGNRDLMDEGRDGAGAAEGHRVMAQTEARETRETRETAETAETVPGPLTAAYKVKKMGWKLRPGVSEAQDLDLDAAAKAPGATLGLVVEEAIRQYQAMVDMSAQDLRLLNWHIANLEYSNAINHAHLSLQGWDIDAGNEWEGKHSMVIGGYQSVARGLMLCPTPLAVERNAVVTRIEGADEEEDEDERADEDASRRLTVTCANGQTWEADYVVNTIPLGVLKHGDVVFEPPLPAWKTGVIERLGYGVLNKLMLTFPRVFWDGQRDIFGVLREPSTSGLDSGLDSLDQADYVRRRGRMFQWFNVTTSAGLPCLLALLAGDAAFDAETTSDDVLVAEAMAVLRSVFERSAGAVPDPVEAVVTRWGSDPLARGSYSSAGPAMRIDDYDVMARPVGRRLLFAGEHTSGTHPATVHGAYLSGLRAAGDLVEALLGGRVEVPTPLVAKRKEATPATVAPVPTPVPVPVPVAPLTHRDRKASLRRRREARERRIEDHVRARLGERPLQPARVVDTSYLLFSKANYERARRKCEEAQRSRRKAGPAAASVARALPNDVRVLTSKMWRSASAEERQPYAEQAAAEKKTYVAAMERFAQEAAAWDAQAAVLRAAYEEEEDSSDVEMTG